MAEITDLDLQSPIAQKSDYSGLVPSEDFEKRWHDLVIIIEDLTARIEALESP